MTREERILDVFDPGVWLRGAEVRKLARMDTSTAIYTLRRLAAEGVLEHATLETTRRGAPAHLYRLAMRRAS